MTSPNEHNWEEIHAEADRSMGSLVVTLALGLVIGGIILLLTI